MVSVLIFPSSRGRCHSRERQMSGEAVFSSSHRLQPSFSGPPWRSMRVCQVAVSGTDGRLGKHTCLLCSQSLERRRTAKIAQQSRGKNRRGQPRCHFCPAESLLNAHRCHWGIADIVQGIQQRGEFLQRSERSKPTPGQTFRSEMNAYRGCLREKVGEGWVTG